MIARGLRRAALTTGARVASNGAGFAALLGSICLLISDVAEAQSSWQFELGLTLPANFPMPLVISQEGQPDLDFTARYISKPLDVPVTWQARIGRWHRGRAWELELIHHKLYLQNRPPEVQAFSISHGLNLLTLQRAWRHEHFQWRVGGGVVFAHAESTVRGSKLDEVGGSLVGGYTLTGPTVTGAMARPFRLGMGAFVNLEGKAAFAYASVPVSAGRARGFSLFVQLAVLVGYGSEGKIPNVSGARDPSSSTVPPPGP